MRWPTTSLRTRFLLLATGIAALVIVLAGVPLVVMLRAQARGEAERQAESAAEATAVFVSTDRYDATVLAAYVARINARGDVHVTVVTPSGAVLGATQPPLQGSTRNDRGLFTNPPRQPAAGGDHDKDNLGRVSMPRQIPSRLGSAVEVLVTARRGATRVYAVTPVAIVADRLHEEYLLVTGVALALLLVAGVAAELSARRLVRPLALTAETAMRLSNGENDARAPEQGPVEVARVAQEINALADRLDELLAREREEVADLSHRLRTPLTAVRLSVEALPADGRRDELEQQIALLERTLTMVIRAARMPQREGAHPRCDAVAVVRERVAFWAPLAEDQHRSIRDRLPGGEAFVRASEEDLAVALDALLENVFAHTEEGVGCEVALGRRGGEVTIDVLDEGGGFTEAALERGRSDRGSSGLGLDIAQSLARSTGGRLELIRAGGRTGPRLVLNAVDTGHTPERLRQI